MDATPSRPDVDSRPVPQPAVEAVPATDLERAGLTRMPGRRSSGSGTVRASNAEREMVARIINLATAEGMLTLDEADERLRLAYAAKIRDELAPLTADLPDGGRRLLENTPEARAAARSGVVRHGISVGTVGLVLVTIWLAASIASDDAMFFWPMWPLMFMAFGVFGHARRVRRWR